MDMITVDMLPYSIVEGDAFKRLNYFADPVDPRRFRLKTEKYFRTTMMPATYEKVCGHVTKLLTEAQWISFTTDGWSNPTKTCSLLSFTAHFVRENVRQKVILSAMVLEENHTQGQSIPPETMMHFPPCFRFPPYLRTIFGLSTNFLHFYLFAKNFLTFIRQNF